eukprot:TRINITY_DN23583_c0_g1_i2.p1 TRINITY_DN23583_c0_g1~~TRINITY_DN23583_c0_g1_i2.p1  ORF type:complete len:522 (-),score=115.17 TRINITY_DN23583_c0_g1_i2:35-1543(-)
MCIRDRLNPGLSSTKSMIGTIPYFSPEMLKTSIKNEEIHFDIAKSDVFALGLVCLYTCSMKEISGLNSGLPDSQIKLTSRINEIESTYSPLFANLLRLMLVIDPVARKSFDEIRQLAYDSKWLSPPQSLNIDPKESVQSIVDKSKAISEKGQNGEALLLLRKAIDTLNMIHPPSVESSTREEFRSMILGELINLSKREGNHHNLESLIDCMNKLGFPNNLAVSDVYFDLGNAYSDLKYFDKALNAYTQALTIRNNILGEDTQRTADLYYNIGVVYMHMGRLDESLQYFDRSLKLRIKLLGEKHDKVADTYHNVAYMYGELGNIKMSLENYNKCKQIRLELYGEGNEKTGDTFYNLGWTYLQAQEYQNALENLRKCREIRLKVSRERVDKIADVNIYLGWCYLYTNQIDLALQHFLDSLGIRTKLYGVNSEKALSCYQGLAQAYFTQGNFLSARDYNLKILNVIKKLPNYPVERIQKIEEKIIECANKLALKNSPTKSPQKAN